MFRSAIFIAILVTIVSCLRTVSKIDGIFGAVKLHEFDPCFNSYVLTFNSTPCPCTSHVYKLDEDYNVLYEWELNKTIKTITVTGRGDVYVTTADPADVLILRSNESEFDHLYPYYGKWDEKGIFLDDDDNFYHNTLEGVVLLRYNSRKPVLIKNLEGAEIKNDHAIDCLGNIYMVTTDERIVMIPTEERNKTVPTAKFRDDITEKQRIFHRIQTDEHNNIYFVFSTGVKKLTNGTLTKVIDDLPTDFCSTDDRIFVSDMSETNFSTYYKTFGDDVMMHSLDGFEYPVDFVRCDNSGNVYFGINTVKHKNEIYILKKGESEITKMNFPGTSFIYSMILDLDDNLVVVSHDVYYFQNGTIDAVKIPGLPRARFHTAKLNRKTNDILIFKGTMLYTFK